MAQEEQIKADKKFVEHGIRYALKLANKRLLPENAFILCVQPYSALNGADKVCGMDVYVVDVPSEYEYFIAVKSDCYYDNRGDVIVTSFIEYMLFHDKGE